MINPDFLIIGAPKAATTTLSIMLREHPDVAFARIKEPHFFSNPNQFALGWPWYRSLFDHRQPGQILGEASTSYSRIRSYPKVVRRIQRYLPDVKIIYMVRNPLDRIRSAYIERLSEPGFPEAYSTLEEALCNIPAMIDSSRHFEIYNAYRQRFPQENIKIIWFEELMAETDRVFIDLCSFLGIAQVNPVDVDQGSINSRESVVGRIEKIGRSIEHINLDWTDKARALVLEEIGNDMKQFLEYSGRSESHWIDLSKHRT